MSNDERTPIDENLFGPKLNKEVHFQFQTTIENNSISTTDSIPGQRRQENGNTLHLNRSAYTYDELEEAYQLIPQENKPKWRCPSLARIIPVIGFVKNYNIYTDFVPDLLSGLSVACLHLPQGLAYGLLASLTPISGVYTSIFSVSVYVIFGTVPHMSMGTNAVLSLVVASMVEREAENYLAKNKPSTVAPMNTSTSQMPDIVDEFEEDDAQLMDVKLGLAMMSTFLCGVILLAMGIFRMGFLTNYMPSSFVGGFTSAAALHIIMSQMKHVFHIKVPLRDGFGKLIFSAIDVITGLNRTNVADLVVCLCSMLGLKLFDLTLNVKIAKKFGHPLPSNLLLVVVGTVTSFALDLHTKYHVAVVGPVGTGLPMPSLPFMGMPMIRGLLYDSAVQATIVFTMTISMAMLMAKMHDYELDANRELVAYGACNLLSSFFPVQSSSVSPPRTMILSKAKARTTLNGIPTAIILIAGVGFLGGLFQPLPKATLAAMIIVAVLDVLMQCRTVVAIWQISRTDGIVWISTWVSTTGGDLIYGLIVGVLMAGLLFMVNNQYIKGELVMLSTKEDLLVPGSNRTGTQQMDRTRIFYFPSQLFFANAESFKAQFYHHVFDPADQEMVEVDGSDSSDPTRDSMNSSLSYSKHIIDTIIIDCSAITYVDIDGINMLKAVVLRYHNVGVTVLLARVPHTTMEKLELGGLFSLMPRFHVFHDVPDALHRKTDIALGLGPARSNLFFRQSLTKISTADLSIARQYSNMH